MDGAGRIKTHGCAILEADQRRVARRFLAAEEEQRRHLVVYLSGAHAYGFPSPDSDLDLAGYTTQAHFLLDCGLVDGLDDVQLDDQSRIELTGQVQRLTLPAELGEAIKVLALSRGLTQPLLGFRSRDLSHRL